MSFMEPPARTLARRVVFYDLLVDSAEDRLAGAVEHLDADMVAELHERRGGLAGVDRLTHPSLGDARAAGRRIAVGDRAGTDDRPRLQGACLGGMGDQLAEIEGEVGSGV